MNYGRNSTSLRRVAMQQSKAKKAKKVKKSISFSGVFLVLLVIAIVVLLAGGILFKKIIDNAPIVTEDTLKPSAYTTTAYANDEKTVIGTLVDAGSNRVFKPLEKIPQDLQNAFIAVEDSRFYQHKGVDWKGVARAVVTGISSGNFSQGGSTITQQLIKNSAFPNFSQETQFQRVERKIQELYLATKVEKTIGKDEILENYNKALRQNYEKSSEEFISDIQHRSHMKDEKKDNVKARRTKDNLQNKNEKKNQNAQVTSANSNNTANNASSKASSIACYVNSSLEIVDAETPETLKLQNYSAKKNYQRYKRMQEREDGNTDTSNDALNEMGKQVKTYSYKGFKIWKALGKILWRIHWIAGLVYTCVSILLVAIFGIMLICAIPNTENESNTSAGKAVAEFAAGEIGNHGSKYNNWRGAAPGTAWCQNFVEYVLHKSGYGNLASGAGGVTSAYNYYKNHPKIATIHVVEGKKKDNLGVTPQPGWLVVFEWADGDKYRDHIGIVESYNSSTGIVTTIEGNTWVGKNKPLRTSVCRVHRKVGISPEKKHIYAFIELAYPKS